MMNLSEEGLFYSLSVARVKLSKLKIPETVVFNLGDFYGEYKTNESQEKLDFLYTALIDKYYSSNYRKFIRYIKYLEKLLLDSGAKTVIFEDPQDGEVFNDHKDWFKSFYHEKYGSWKSYSIDTDDMADELFDELICHSNRRLLSFLFSSKSILNMQWGSIEKRADLGPEKNTDKVYYDWTWFC